MYISRYAVGHNDFSPETFSGGYGIGQLNCNGDEASLVDCDGVEIEEGGLTSSNCRNSNNNRDVGIVCGMTCEEQY